MEDRKITYEEDFPYTSGFQSEGCHESCKQLENCLWNRSSHSVSRVEFDNLNLWKLVLPQIIRYVSKASNTDAMTLENV